MVIAILSLAVACSSKGSSNEAATPEGTPDGSAPLADAGTGTSDADPAAAAGSLAIVDGWLDTYKNGGTIDYDGDGKADVTITANADGSRDIHVAGAHGDRVITHFVSTTNLSETSDQNDDGVMDTTWVVSKTGDTVTSVETTDGDFDGAADVRTTTTKNHGHTATTVESFLNALDGSGKAWTTTSAYENDAPPAATGCVVNPPPPAAKVTGQPAGATPGLCDGYCNFDCTIPTLTTTFDPIGGSSRLFLVASGVSACNAVQRGTLLEALMGLPEAFRRLRKINPIKLNRLNQVLFAANLRYGCGAIPACIPGGVVAATVEDDPPEEVRGPGFKTVFATGAGQAIDEPTHDTRVSATAELLFHELFHLYKPHNVDPGGQDARDDIYSCSRYMAEWKSGLKYYLGSKVDASSARDGAVCATDDHKIEFGKGEAHLLYDHLYYQTSPTSPPTEQMLCLANSMPVAYATCGVEKIWSFCDQTPLPGDKRTAGEVDVFQCATECPPGTQEAAPCNAGQPPDTRFSRVGGCTKVPPSLDY